MKETYNTHTAPQVLHLTSLYLNGNGIESAGKYGAPTNPEQYSTFEKNSYLPYDNFKMETIIKQHMDENRRFRTTSNMTVQKSVIMN